MRKLTLLLGGYACIAMTGCGLLSNKEERDLSTDKSLYKARNKMSKQDRIDLAMQQEAALTKDPALGSVPRERLFEAMEFKNAKLWSSARTSTSVSGINWAERGPNNVGGRTRALWFDLSDAANGYKKVWAGGVAGGLWVTNDITVASPSWTKMNDFFDNLAVTCFAQNPSNPLEMYFGTGEGWFNIDAVRGLGIWKSSNGGASWAPLASTANFFFVQDLQFDNNGNLYASVRLNDQGAGAQGLQKSTDGGATWATVLSTATVPASSTNSGGDLELAANGDLYVTMGIFSNGGIYRSPAGATVGNLGTWVNITPNTAGVISTPANFWNRIELATAPSNADIVYALFQGNGSNNCTSIQRYNLATNSWTLGTVPTIIDQGSNSNFTRGQAWYDLIAAVDPNNENSLYIGGVDALRSDNGGSTWTQMTTWSLFAATGFTAAQNVHADHHNIVYAPGNSSIAIWATDGGIYYTTNANIASTSKPTFVSKNSGYNVTQFYSAAMHPTLPNYYLGGTQDNGTQKFTAAGLSNTTQATGGDGLFTHIDQDNGNIQITSLPGNDYFVSTNGGNAFTRYTFSGGSFINPTDYDNAGNILYAGNTAGTFFRWTNPAANTANAVVTVSSFAGASITHVAVSPQTANRVYFGLNNGSVVRVNNAHTGSSIAGTIIRPASGSVSVSSIAIDPSNEDHMLVTYSNYGTVSVFESVNATQATPTWTAVEGNLPDMPVRWVMFDPRNPDWALLATELGVWSTDNLDGAATDWDPTNTNLANVRVDMLQYSTASRILLAASHGRGFFTATVPAVTTPDVNFSTGASPVTELTSTTSGCRYYTDYTVPMTIANAPAGDATVTVSLQSGGTATQGVDFDFTTNGNFAAPSSSFVFANSSTASNNITIRIYNDAEVEPVETFTLEYTISGTTNAQRGTSFQTHNFSITSNDAVPIGTGPGTATVGTGDFGGYFQPFRSNFSDAKSQYIYLASELTAAGFVAGNINSIAFNVLNKTSTQPYNGLTISLKLTSNSSFSTTAFETGTTVFFSGTRSTVLGLNTFNFTTSAFNWDGTSNLLVEICFDNASATGSGDLVSTNTTANARGVWNRDNAAPGCTLAAAFNSAGSSSFVRPDITLAASLSGVPVETVAGNNRTEHLGNNGTYYFYSTATGNLINNITGASASLGCVSSSVFEAGATWQTFQSGQRSQKVIEISPTTNSGASFTIGLYYTAAELAGKTPATLRIAKTTAASMAAANSSNTVIVPATVSAFGTGYLFTGAFTGFSKFFLVDNNVTLPVSLVKFDGRLEKNVAHLNWSTSSEQNSKNFEVEKSADGVNYYRIGLVTAAGNSTTERDYSLRDDKLSPLNYYRLRMNDNDGRSKLSSVVLLKYTATAQNVGVVNNPFTGYIDLRLAKDASMAKLQLIAVSGTVVAEKTVANPVGLIHWQLSNDVSAGAYILRAVVDGKVFTNKLVKQ